MIKMFLSTDVPIEGIVIVLVGMFVTLAVVVFIITKYFPNQDSKKNVFGQFKQDTQSKTQTYSMPFKLRPIYLERIDEGLKKLAQGEDIVYEDEDEEDYLDEEDFIDDEELEEKTEEDIWALDKVQSKPLAEGFSPFKQYENSQETKDNSAKLSYNAYQNKIETQKVKKDDHKVSTAAAANTVYDAYETAGEEKTLLSDLIEEDSDILKKLVIGEIIMTPKFKNKGHRKFL